MKLTFINSQRQDMEKREAMQRSRRPAVENRTRQTNERRQNGGHNSGNGGVPWQQQVCFNQNLKETFSNKLKKIN